MADPASPPPLVLCERQDVIATVTFNRPQVLNALSIDLFLELQDHLRSIAADPDIDVVILAGAGRAWSAGADLAQFAGAQPHARPRRVSPRIAQEINEDIEALPQPVIAAVQGYCLTGALEILLCCDLVVAEESARFGDTHAKWGLVPGAGMNLRLPRRVGLAKAKEMSFTARFYSAAECAAMGLVNQVVPDGELADAARTLAQAIRQNSRESISKQKKLYNDGWAGTLRDALRWAEDFNPGHAADRQERINAFSKS